MKNKWFIKWLGYVKVRIEGRGAERFVNECVRRNLLVWDVKKIADETLVFCMLLRDVKKIKPIYRKNECKLYFIGRYGFPFWNKRLIKNSGFLIGFLIFFFGVIAMSNMVWKIEITGAKPETEYILMKELDKMGIKKGKLQFQMPNVEDVQRHLTDNINAITWAGLEVRGTTYHFKIVEKNEPKKEKEQRPQNLVAKKEAIITKTFVEVGKPVVLKNDHVEKGQILVSGIYGNEESPTIVSAKGIVYGETWYTSKVDVPLKTQFQVYTGNVYNEHFLKFGDTKIKIWGFQHDKYKRSRTESVKHDVKLFGFTLPIAYEKDVVREEEEANREYTEKQALKVAKEMAEKELKKKLDEHAMIVSDKILSKKVEADQLKVTLHYTVVENIAEPQPISESDIQGD
ncbi:sporulation protein YqfD [Bacillus cereus]|uniref:sporulation protein YqfD n=1 Tax=Bacillus cereus group TaxID=86661 RepID=UPI000B599468|nr:sporulation protein YqfD [Bacillus cereus]ASI85412.1 Stage IV sporulation protein [Bacillus cereus]MDA2702286.1 sporulation protein YqfD [Bacillus cereus]MDA2707866.1 sporulation protein YqfD [Bacillus cereus]